MRLIVTRPEEDARPLAEALSGLGHEALLCPLMQVRDLPVAIETDAIAAVLVTSANGARAAARKIPPARRARLPVYAVGEASARAAHEAGFAEIVSAEGDVAALAALVADRRSPGDGTLLHVAGTVTAGDLAGALSRAGFDVKTVQAYEAVPAVALPADIVAALEQGGIDGVLFYSPRTARIWQALVEGEGLAERLRPVAAYCLSERVADIARALPYAKVVAARAPTQNDLLNLLTP